MSDDETTQTETTEREPLAPKIARAMASIDSVPKRGYNDFNNYEYATADDVMEVARRALGREGVAVYPEVQEESWAKEQTSSGGTQSVLWLTVEYTVTDGYTERVCRWRAQAKDSGDKAYYKAYTQAKKYFLRELLNISTGEPLDVEFDGGDRGGSQSSSNARGQRQPRRSGGQPSRGASQPHGGGGSNGNIDHETQTKRLHALLGEVTLADRYKSGLRTYIRREANLDDDAEWSKVPANHLKWWADQIDEMDTDNSGGPSERNREIVQLCKDKGLVDDTDAAAE